MAPVVPIENLPTADWTIYQLVKAIQGWANSVKYVSYERRIGRSSQNDQWLEDVGVRIDTATTLLLAKLREAHVIHD